MGWGVVVVAVCAAGAGPAAQLQECQLSLIRVFLLNDGDVD